MIKRPLRVVIIGAGTGGEMSGFRAYRHFDVKKSYSVSPSEKLVGGPLSNSAHSFQSRHLAKLSGDFLSWVS